jgi:hypothetical protein
MKKVVFLIGMMVGFTSTVLAQYDVVTVSSEEGFEDFDTWYQIKGNTSEYFFFAENDENMDKYVDHILSHYKCDVKNPTSIENTDGTEYITYYTEYEDLDPTTVVIGYDDESVSIYIYN